MLRSNSSFSEYFDSNADKKTHLYQMSLRLVSLVTLLYCSMCTQYYCSGSISMRSGALKPPQLIIPAV